MESDSQYDSEYDSDDIMVMENDEDSPKGVGVVSNVHMECDGNDREDDEGEQDKQVEDEEE
jgi:hypothetical protein